MIEIELNRFVFFCFVKLGDFGYERIRIIYLCFRLEGGSRGV